MKTFLLSLGIIFIQFNSFSQATHPYTNCPDVNIAIVRAGTNASITNPYFLYNVNQSTGAMTLVPGGPYKDPANTTLNLQINGIGVSRKDGFIYGLAFDGTTTTARFMRLDANYGVSDLGAVPSPASGTGLLGIVNPAAGDMDTAGNFYFSAFTFNPLPTPTFDKFYIGKISNTQSIVTGPPVVQYFEVDVSSANCTNYISTLTSDPNNSGLKDFSYNSRTNSFFTYATYKLPGATNFSAQVLELVPIPGSSPLRYRLVCNSTVNTHTAETSGTLIDKTGKFTVLFTDGSFGMVNGNASTGFTGGFTMISTNTGLPNPLRGDMGSCGQGSPESNQTPTVTPFPNCPDVDVAIVRAGTNADITNPYFLYNVNNTTGAMTLVPGGPYKDPVNPTQNLQVNGIGVSRKDGFIYGIAFDGTTTTAHFMRLGSNYGATDLGIISPPSGAGVIGIVNPAAGDMDTAGNFYFSAFTFNLLPTPTFDKFYIGKISNTQSIVSGPPVVQYFEVDVSSANCTDYISTLTSDPNNSGLKDFSYNSRTNSFFTYATYKLPGATNFSAQVLELVPISGSSPLRYRLVCNSTVNTHTAETSGTLIDKTGKFTVLFTDGSFGMVNGNASTGFTGGFTMISTSTGLPNPLRGDMGSCGQGSLNNEPPVTTINCPVNYAVVRAGTNADITNPYSLYTVNGITGALTLIPGGPLFYPGTSQPLQINGIGVNKLDGLIYGIAFEGLTTARFVKTDAAYHVTLMGVIPPPPQNSVLTPSFVNSAAGTMDDNGNFYFTAVTTKVGNSPSGLVIDKLWLGKIANVSTVTGTLTPVYYEVDWSGNPCKDFISSLNNDPVNSGIKDLFYHPVTRTFFTYATYKLAGDNQFRGQMLELRPVGGSNSPNSYKLHCNDKVEMHNAETSGVMVTNEGAFLILMTDGTVGLIPRTGNSFNYSGDFVELNKSTGLPPVIRADLGSCTDLQHPGENGDRQNVSINFTLRPNPVAFNQDIVIRWKDVSNSAPVSILIYDNYGTVVRRVTNVMAVEGDQLSISLGNLSSGIYYVQAISADGRAYGKMKFIKMN
ncbi:MAG: T9SS type A sorting domain-containing protein [Bacteroidetes bacterium]|nr:MAG: T9SS type A sorting domain-containing protein [Bacteroidota bacterium]